MKQPQQKILFSAVLLSAGEGKRFASFSETSKQYLKLIDGSTPLERSFKALLPFVSKIILVLSEKYFKYIQNKINVPTNSFEVSCLDEQTSLDELPFNIFELKRLAETENCLFSIACGGKERQDSVFSGLSQVNTQYVLIHDSARPMVSGVSLNRLVDSVQEKKAAILGAKISDTVKRTDENYQILETIDRSSLWSVQTPQGFETSLIFGAMQSIIQQGIILTDDSAFLEQGNLPVYIVENNQPNPKITYPQDLDYVNFLISKNPVSD